MGRHDLRQLRVHDTAKLLLRIPRRMAQPPGFQTMPEPPWFQVMTDYPPSQALVRPHTQRESDSNVNSERARARNLPPPKVHRRFKKPSKMFMPLPINYEEDRLRREFYGDHPWELARPRVILENDGLDYQRWDWSRSFEESRPVTGESVVQRQMYLMNREDQPLSKAEAYDQARKEFYDIRTSDEIEQRVAREEASSTGAQFGKSAMEVGMQLENEEFERWKEWARQQATLMEQARSAAYTGAGTESRPGTDEVGFQSSGLKRVVDQLDEFPSAVGETTVPGTEEVEV